MCNSDGLEMPLTPFTLHFSLFTLYKKENGALAPFLKLPCKK